MVLASLCGNSEPCVIVKNCRCSRISRSHVEHGLCALVQTAQSLLSAHEESAKTALRIFNRQHYFLASATENRVDKKDVKTNLKKDRTA